MKTIFFSIIIMLCFIDKAKSNKESINYILPPDTFIYSQLQVTKILTDVGFAKSYDWLTTAGFYDNVTRATLAVTNVKYGNSFLVRDSIFNGIYKDTLVNYYPDSTRQWIVTGQGSIPNFTYTSTDPMPNFLDYNLVDDTITVSAGVTIPFSNISNATNLTIVISDGVNEVIESFPVSSSSSQSRLTSGASLNANSISISSTDLSILSTTNNAFINILVSNVDYQEFSGKRVAFVKTFFYKRDRVVIQ